VAQPLQGPPIGWYQ